MVASLPLFDFRRMMLICPLPPSPLHEMAGFQICCKFQFRREMIIKINNKDSLEHTDAYNKFKLGRSQEVYSVRIAQKNRGGKHLTVEICPW